jgi:hypothetical protein
MLKLAGIENDNTPYFEFWKSHWIYASAMEVPDGFL